MKKSAVIFLSLAFTAASVIPSYARGFGGGGFGGGHSFGGFGGDHSFGGGDRDYGGDRDWSGGDRSMSSDTMNRSFGDDTMRGDRSFGQEGFAGHPFDSGSFSHFNDSGFSHWNSGNFSGNNLAHNLPNEGGFGHIASLQNRTPTNFNHTDLENQGNSIRNSFNNDTVNVNKNYNYTHVGNNYGGYGYHPYGYGAYGYHGYYGYGYHPYGYGWGYPSAWYVPGWSSAMAWTCMGLTSLDTFLGIAALSDMGGGGGGGSSCSNVTYNNENVYVNGQPAGTASQYYTQSQQLAQQGVTSATTNGVTNYGVDQSKNWEPLGVFAIAEPGQTSSNMLLQLAINKDGVIHGNYYNQLTNESSEVYGSLDKKTQRVSWTIGTNTSTVFDASLGDLVKNDSQVLVHYSPTNTQRMALIRLQQPPQNNNPQIG